MKIKQHSEKEQECRKMIHDWNTACCVNSISEVFIKNKEETVMRVMLTSCGFETKRLEKVFLMMLGKAAEQARVLFIPTAAKRIT